MNTISDSDLPLLQYWDKYRLDIADAQGWYCSEYCHVNSTDCLSACTNRNKRKTLCKTLVSYGRYIAALNRYLPKISISDLTLGDFKYALKEVQSEKGWADSTIGTIQSCLRDIFRFAANHGDAYDIFNQRQKRKLDSETRSLLDLMNNTDDTDEQKREKLQKLREKNFHRTKSLTVEQIEALTKLISKNIKSDGRYCALAIMLYAGVRPAEVRALNWKDLVPFLDHPDRLLLRLYKTANKQGLPQDSMKTKNAYRILPVHFELSQLLEQRYQAVLSSCGKPPSPIWARPMDHDIAEMPICCFKNEMNRYCKDYEVALLAQQVFDDDFKLKKIDMYVYMLDNYIEELSHTQEGMYEESQQLTLYVLRRNFWTWLESSTQLTDFEKRYIMGHSMEIDGKSLRPEYNNENLLWSICQKMDRCVQSQDLHQIFMMTPLENSYPTFLENRGIVYLSITKEILQQGGIINLDLITTEKGDSIHLRTASAIQGLGTFRVKSRVIDGSYPVPQYAGINCEYENWMVHKRVAGSLP